MGIIGSLRSFFFESLILGGLVGYGFYWAYTTLYPQYSDNYLYLGLIILGFTLFVNFSSRIAKKIG